MNSGAIITANLVTVYYFFPPGTLKPLHTSLFASHQTNSCLNYFNFMSLHFAS